MKKDRIIYWAATGFIFLFEGVMPALTSQSEMAKAGISHLGYPEYFGAMLAFFKVAGSLALVLPMIKGRLKEWIYAGFVFDFICAAISLWVVDGLSATVLFPLFVLAILLVSYRYYHKLQATPTQVAAAQLSLA